MGNADQGALWGLGKSCYALGRPKELQSLSGAQAGQGGVPVGWPQWVQITVGSHRCPSAPRRSLGSQ